MRKRLRWSRLAAPERFADAMDFARETGMREDEIFGLIQEAARHRQHHHLRQAQPAPRDSLHPPSAEDRRAPARHIGSQYVFWHGDGERWKSPASRFGDIRRRVARKAAHGFRGFRFHDFRHLYAVEYLKAGKGIAL
jgi:integrase/recombinase XerD